MSKIIAVATSKGGVGKTTISIGIAETLSRETGEPCLLLDLDPQGSATRWAETAELASEVVPVVARSAGAIPREIRQHSNNRDWTVIDTPPGDIGIMDAAIGEADIVIVPTGPTPLDLPQAAETFSMIEGPTVLVLLNKVDGRTNSRTLAREVLLEAGLPLLDTEIRNLQAIANLGSTTWPTSGLAVESFNDLVADLVQRSTAAA